MEKKKVFPMELIDDGFSEEVSLGGVYDRTWMKELSDTKKLSDLSIPGTHNTMANEWVMWDPTGFGETQSLYLGTQLASGIRFLDIRLKYNRPYQTLECFHGILWLGAYFDDVLKDVRTFLENIGSGETIYMRIAQENSSVNDNDFANAVRAYCDEFAAGRRYTGGTTNQNPTLEQTRGKFVILLDINGYNSTTHGDLGINYRSTSFNKQDAWQTAWDPKVELVNAHLRAANNRGTSSTTTYVNYLSANLGTTSGYPKGIARFVNPRVTSYLFSQKFKYVGIVVADYPGRGFIREIIQANFGVPIRDGTVARMVPHKNSGGTNNYVLDMHTDDNSKVTLWQGHGGLNQQWAFKYDADTKRYSIINVWNPSKGLVALRVADGVSYATLYDVNSSTGISSFHVKEVAPGEYLFVDVNNHNMRRDNNTTKNYNGLLLRWPYNNEGDLASHSWKLWNNAGKML
ncbi:phosphatidylinositol-specific phospholipase C [Listeria rocourtiae]|uniref:phosphatidylinositol-specific phospholipase C n=1 Tax=Listeria rocourtiae TaxID=647910 RepID=UPI001628A9AB|nr:phosphatidylinositol-specific phospholipase C [Listeria rocourtiae]MBC1433809.1 phosphatidylinositol-specific phospholipase C [Listeria rocourtiae]